MNFYPHHIGDFLKDTNFLSNEEQMIYLKLIWLYYDTEQPLPDDILVLSMKCNCRDKETELNGILGLFFKADGDTWRHTRCDAEIAKYHNILTERSKAGKASAVQRALKNSATSVEQVLNTSATNGQQSSTNQEPRTNNQVNLKEKDKKESRAPRFDAQAHLCSLGVYPQIAMDWIAHRKAKKATPTRTAIDGIALEAEKAGIALTEALSMCCQRGWVGFKEEWIAKDYPAQTRPINGRQAAISNYAAQAAEARAKHDFSIVERDITGEAIRVA